jgi:hypothetical protein
MLVIARLVLMGLTAVVLLFFELKPLQAETTCQVRVRIVFLQENESGYAPVKGWDQTVLDWQDYEVTAWQDCYREAEKLAGKYASKAQYTLGDGDVTHSATGFRYVEWQLKNGFLWSFRTAGSLTKITPLYFNASKGDVRVFELRGQHLTNGTPNRIQDSE